MSTNAATLLMRIGTELVEPVRRDMSTASLNRRNDILVKLQSKIEPVAATIKKISGDASLSDVGRAERLATLATASVPDFKFMGIISDEVDAALAQLVSQLFTVESPVKEAMLRELRAQEIRTGLRGLAQHERDVAFLKAAEHDQLETMAAMLDAPGEPLVREEVRERALQARTKRREPEMFAAYQQAQLLADILRTWREHVGMWLRGLGADPATVAAALKLDYDPPTGFRPPRNKDGEWAKGILAAV